MLNKIALNALSRRTAPTLRALSTSAGVTDRERSLENAAVRKHEQEQLKKLAKQLGLAVDADADAAAAALRPVAAVTIVGAGLMGAGVAQVAAQNGFQVRLVDRTDAVLTASKVRIGESVARVAKKSNAAPDWAANVLKNIQLYTNLEQACAGTDVVVEAVVENLQAKWELFSQIEKFVPPHAVLASNTSSLSIGQIASAIGNPARLGGLHFFNPVPVMQLVEVVHAPKTSAETVSALTTFGQRLGKTVVHARDTPGFIVNRLLVPFMAEAMRMLERGDASPHDIDTAMKLGAAHPMGPLALADYVGLDTCKFIMDGWAEAYPEETLYRTPDVLTKLVGSGQLGNKSGAGFFKGKDVNPMLAGFLSK